MNTLPKKSRTEGEKKSSNRFTEAREMWKMYRRAIGTRPMWRIMAREMGVAKSDSLFHSENSGCFQPGKGVWAFPTFRFSTGTLDTPVITNAERDGWKVTHRWENGEVCPKASSSYQVFVGYFYGSATRTPQLFKGLVVYRGDSEVTLEIPPAGQPDGTPLHLYLFFGNENPDRFSPSEYAGV